MNEQQEAPQEPILNEQGLRVCAEVIGRREAFAYLDVARAMFLSTYQNEGPRAGRELGRQLQIIPQTQWNWLNRDKEAWLNRVAARLSPTPKVELQFPGRGVRLTEQDWLKIAQVRHKYYYESARRISRRVRNKALMEPDWAHLRYVSNRLISKNMYKLQVLSAELEKEEKGSKISIRSDNEL